MVTSYFKSKCGNTLRRKQPARTMQRAEKIRAATFGKMGGRTFGMQSLRGDWPVARCGVGWPGPEVLLSLLP
jgi:hypothetical protein